MRERPIFAMIAAVLGAVALWQMFPRYDRSAGLGQLRLSRPEAIAKARDVTRANGIDATNWTPAVQSLAWSGGAWIYLWQRLHPESRVFASLITPYVEQVTLQQPGGDRYAMVTFNARGQLAGFSTQSRVASSVGHVNATETLDAIAERVMAQYLGESAWLFRPVNRGVTQSNQLLYSWEYSDPSDSPHLLRFEASFSEEQLVEAELTAEPAEAFRTEVRDLQAPQSYLLITLVVLIFALVSAAFPSFFRALVRRRLNRQRLVSMGVVALAIVIFSFVGGAWVDEARAETTRQFSGFLSRAWGRLFGMAVLGFGMVLFYGGGRGLLLPTQHDRWLALELLLSRRFSARPIGSALWHGVLCGFALAALPLLIAPLVLPGQPMLANAGVLLAANPLATVWEPLLILDIFAIVLMALPISRQVRPGWLGAALAIVLTTVAWFTLHTPYDDWLWPGLTASFLFGIGIWLVEGEYGALAALVAGGAMVALWNAGNFFVQPAASLSQRGWWILGPLLAAGVVGLVWSRFGSPVDVEAELKALCAETASDVRSQRDRLSSEFDVARRAQQAMLPPVPAQIGNVSFAASCIPARDVGGDLYDFYPTGDGRYAIGVADVSGKGVPAALYMTLTKGFLAAAGRDSDDLLSTVSQLNSHLYAAGKRKIFVTMALVFFSPAERLISLARAGHNPPLWRRPSQGRSEYLTPPGMGLGLTSRLLFERAMRLQEIELEPGDAFVLYSDGITEAMNEESDQFGEDRLQAVVDACDGCDAHATEQAILNAVRGFIGKAPPHDDMTLFVVRV